MVNGTCSWFLLVYSITIAIFRIIFKAKHKKNEYEWTKWNVNMEHIWIRLGKGYVFGMYVKKKWNKNRFPRKLNYTISTRKRPLFTKWIDNVYFFFLEKIDGILCNTENCMSWLFNWYAYFEFRYLKAINLLDSQFE